MCRLWILRGVAALSFGAGLLLGLYLDSGFFPFCLGLGMVFLGCCLLRKK